jgi:exo-1,4-beta-D-glucosaminidase
MGLNCIRFENIWGKDSYIYDLCDEEGILAIVGWSCQWEWEGYCGIPHSDLYGCINDPERNALAYRYFRDQMRWIRNHPSIAAFLTGSDRIANPQLEPLYLKEFKALGLEFSYICSAASKVSLAGPSGNKMTGPYEYCGPEYWVSPQADGGALGFNTETGIGLNMPQLESVKRMIAPEDLWPVGKAWDSLCTVAGEGMHDTHVIREVVSGQYGEPSSVEEFVARAQAADYTGTRGMYEAFRINIGKATGVVQWMLNSAVPMLYWQLYDWYGIPTAGYYGTKKALEPVQLLLQWEERKLYAVNGLATGSGAAKLDCTVRIFDAASREIQSVPVSVSVPEGKSVPVLDLPEGEDLFVFVEGGANNIYAVPAQGNVHDFAHSGWFQTPISTYANLSYVTALPAPDLSVKEDGAHNVTVVNNSDTVAFQVVLKLLDGDGELVPEAFWSDNFFSLPPHGSITVSHEGRGKVAWTAGL